LLRFHLYFKHPVFTTRAKVTPWHPCLEFRGCGGLLVCPPSLHASGRRYAWAMGRAIWEVPRPELPRKVVDCLIEQARRPVAESVDNIGPGDFVHLSQADGLANRTRQFLAGMFANGPKWNDRLFRAACDLSGVGIPLHEAMLALLAGAQPWDRAEEEKARQTILSAYARSRLPGRSYRSAGDQGPKRTWTVGAITIREFHP
jgi:hypothetical protein